LQPVSIWSGAGKAENFPPQERKNWLGIGFVPMARAAPLPLWCWTLALMIWLLPMLSPPLIFPWPGSLRYFSYC